MSKKPTYKQENGTTRIGDFLRSINKSSLFTTALDIAEKGVFGTLKEQLLSSKELRVNEKKIALEYLKKDIEESKQITERWKFDMSSDSWLSKNVRPITLLYSWFLITLMIFFKPLINENYIDMVQIITLTINGAYFGSRAYNKYTTLKQKNNVRI